MALAEGDRKVLRSVVRKVEVVAEHPNQYRRDRPFQRADHPSNTYYRRVSFDRQNIGAVVVARELELCVSAVCRNQAVQPFL